MSRYDNPYRRYSPPRPGLRAEQHLGPTRQQKKERKFTRTRPCLPEREDLGHCWHTIFHHHHPNVQPSRRPFRSWHSDTVIERCCYCDARYSHGIGDPRWNHHGQFTRDIYATQDKTWEEMTAAYEQWEAALLVWVGYIEGQNFKTAARYWDRTIRPLQQRLRSALGIGDGTQTEEEETEA